MQCTTRHEHKAAPSSGNVFLKSIHAMLEESNTFTMVLLDLSSLQTNVLHNIANY